MPSSASRDAVDELVDAVRVGSSFSVQTAKAQKPHPTTQMLVGLRWALTL